ncbi:MAG: hypothetical protein WD009_00650 [Phycisphaeraceae bacterium]
MNRPRSISPLPALAAAFALTAAGLGAAPAPPSTPGPAERMLADQFAVLTRQVLEAPIETVPSQLEQARILLDEALALRPDDPELWHLRVELAEALEDDNARIAALRQYTRLAPHDDVAATRLLTAPAHLLDTVDQRLDHLVEVLHSDEAREQGDVVRSRIASQAAALAFELGNTARFAELLRQAVRLDHHNVDAARLLLERAQQREAGVRQIGSAAIHLIRAAPGDTLARLTLIEALLRDGDYETAATQFRVTQDLAGRPLSHRAYLNWLVALAGDGQDEALARTLDQLAGPQAQGASDGAGAGGSPFIEAEVPLDFELVRLATTQQQDVLAQRVDRMVDRYDELADDLTPSERDAAGLDLASVASLFGHALDRIPAWVEEADASSDRVQRVLGWAAVHAGDPAAAREHLGPMAEHDPLAALGLAELESGEARLAALEAVFRRDANRLAGMMAARRLREAGAPVTPGETALTLRRAMRGDSRHLWEPAFRTAPWLVLRVRVEPPRSQHLDPIQVRVEMRNAARFPIALEPEAGVPTRAVLLVAPSTGGQSLPSPGPLVVDMRRRLVLEPNQRVTVNARLDRSAFGALAANNPQLGITYGVRGLLGARQTPGGGLAPGPIGYQDTHRPLNIESTRITDDEQLDAQLARLESDDLHERLRAAAVLMRLADVLPEPIDDPERAQRVADAVTATYHTLDPPGQALLQRFIPPREDALPLFREMLDHATANEQPLLWLMHLAVHTTEADHRTLARGLTHDDARVRNFARARRESLRALSDQRDQIERERETQQRQQQQEEQEINLDL